MFFVCHTNFINTVKCFIICNFVWYLLYNKSTINKANKILDIKAVLPIYLIKYDRHGLGYINKERRCKKTEVRRRCIQLIILNLWFWFLSYSINDFSKLFNNSYRWLNNCITQRSYQVFTDYILYYYQNMPNKHLKIYRCTAALCHSLKSYKNRGVSIIN